MTDRFDELDEMELVEHRLALMRAYGEACAAYDQSKAAALHARALEAQREIARRRGDNAHKTGLEGHTTDELVRYLCSEPSLMTKPTVCPKWTSAIGIWTP